MYRSLNIEYLGFETDVERAVLMAHEGGFRGLDLSPRQVLEVARTRRAARLRELMSDKGIHPGCFSLIPRNGSGKDTAWKEDLDRLPELASSVSAMGFRRALFVVLPFDQTLEYDANFQRHRRRIRQVADILRPFEILLGLEYIAPLTRREGYRNHFVKDMADALALAEVADRPNVGLFLDCFHWYCARENASDILALNPAEIAGVHISDAVLGRTIEEQLAFERELPEATGMIDLASFLGALKQIGYNGPVTCEPMSQNLAQLSPLEAVRRTAKAMNLMM